jgi:peptide/nickel transport system permease protein
VTRPRRPDTVTLLALAFLALIVIAAVAAPLIAPYPPNQVDYAATFQGPSAQHLLGTDELGRDLLSRVIYGGQISLVGVFEALAVYLLLGVPAGLAAGYFGGWFDRLVVWLAEISFSLPQIVIVLAVLSVFSNGADAAMLVLGLLGAPGLAVMVRGAAEAVRREQYIAAARTSGLRSWQILVRHVLPRVSGTIVVQASLFAGLALIFQTGLEFLGLGADPPNPSWGEMVATGSHNIARDAWMIVPAGLVITFAVLAFNLLGDAIRDARARSWSAPIPTAAAAGGAKALSLEGAAGERGELAPDLELVATPARNGFAAAPAAEQPLTTRERRHDALLWVEGLSVAAVNRAGERVPLVEAVSFDLDAGRALGIVGESGCGKTLTTLAITGSLPRSLEVVGGEWAFDGQPLDDASEAELRALRGSQISVISQEPVATLDPSFTVGGQVAEVVRRHQGGSRKQAQAKAIELLGKVRLPKAEQVAKRYPHELSGGMAQRVAIAAALAGNPRLLIADEPTTALDPTVQAEILDLLRSLQHEAGLAVILVSHDWGVVADLCDAAIVMYAGQVVEEADVTTLFDSPRHPYTSGLIESNPYHAGSRRTALPMISGAVPAPGQWPSYCHFAPRCPYRQEDCLAGPIAEQAAGKEHWARCIHHDRVGAVLAEEELRHA